MSGNTSFFRIDDTSLADTDFDGLGQPEWVHILRSLYHVFVTFTCIGGNSLVLLASHKYDAMEIDEVSLGLLQNLAAGGAPSQSYFYSSLRFSENLKFTTYSAILRKVILSLPQV